MKEKLLQQNSQFTKLKWLYVIMGIIIMMCLGTVYSWSIFRIPIEELYQIGTTKSGLPYMFSLAFYALFMLFTGRFIEKYNPKIIMIIGGLLVGIGWILSSLAGNIYFLTLTYGVMIGAGVGIVYGVPMNVVAKWFPEKKGLIVGFVLVGFGLSPFITAPFARHLIEIYGVMRTFQILGVIFGLAVPILAFPFRYPTESESEFLGKPTKKGHVIDNINTSAMIKTKEFKTLYINFTMGTMIGLMLVGMTSNIGIDLIKLTSTKVAFLVSLFAVFNGLGRPLFGWFADKVSHKMAMFLSFGLITLAAVLMIFAGEGSTILYTISFSIFWFNLGGWLAIAPATTMTLFGTKFYSQNYGVVFTAYGVGAITGVLTSGLIKDLFHSYNSIFYFVIVLCMIGLFSASRME
jgi:MFS family permease